MLKKIEKGIRYAGSVFAVIGGFLLLVLMFLDTGDVIGRYFFNNPIKGTLEISEVLMGGMVLLSWAYVQKMKGHLSVDLVISRYSSQARAILNFVTLLVSLGIFSIILWRSAILAIQYTQEQRHSTVLNFPVGPFYFLVPIGAVFLCLELIIQVLYCIPEMRRKL